MSHRWPARVEHSLFPLLITATLSLMACQPPAAGIVQESPLPVPTDTPRPPIEIQLREAYRTSDPLLRRAGVLDAADYFLRDSTVRQADDPVAATYFTSVAFSSGRLTLPEPALIRRHGDLAVISLPEALGLYLFDLSAAPGTPPLEVSRWTVGLSALEVTWGTDELGIAFVTVGADDMATVHYALVARTDGTWQVAWFGDEVPDWWFNARGGTLAVAPDLSQVTVTGEVSRTTEAFYEQAGEPQRTFRIIWQRERNGYVMTSPPENYPDRQAWLWHVARPSPYATLVEFIERLQSGDESGAASLVTDPLILSSANDFGLRLADRRFQAAPVSENRLVFRDLQGTFVVDFVPPQEDGAPWLIAGLAPLGAIISTPEAGP